MATHSSTLAWKNPMDGGAWWAAVHRVVKSGTRLSDFTFTFIHWRRKWQPTPVFLPGESQGHRSLLGCCLWACTELDTTEVTQQRYSFSYLEPVCCYMSTSNCCFLTCISQEASQVVWYFHLFQNFPQFIVIHTVKGIGIVNKAEIDVFLELSCFFRDPADVGSLISGSSASSKTILNIWEFTVHVLLKPGLENFEHHFTSV